MDLAVRGDVKVEAIRLADALAAIHTQLWPILDTEGVDTSGARGRVLATDLVAKVNLPHWDSAAVDGRAVIDVVSGASHDPPRPLSIPAGFSFDKQSGVRQFLPGALRANDDGKSVVVPCERQGTAMLSTLTGSDGFIVLDEDREIVRPCELVDFIPCRGIYPRSIRSRPRLLAPSWLEPVCGMICSPEGATVHKGPDKGQAEMRGHGHHSEADAWTANGADLRPT